MKKIKPRYLPGETVYVKEAYNYVTLAEVDPWKERAIADGSFRRRPSDNCPVTMVYKLDSHEIGAGWLTPRGMPQWAARTFQLIKDVRLERLQEITEEDAIKEGVEIFIPEHSYRDTYIALWNSINPKHPFKNNPWVWRYEFEVKR